MLNISNIYHNIYNKIMWIKFKSQVPVQAVYDDHFIITHRSLFGGYSWLRVRADLLFCVRCMFQPVDNGDFREHLPRCAKGWEGGTWEI